MSQAVALLKALLVLDHVRNTSLIEVGVVTDNPREAAELANATAAAYRDHRVFNSKRLRDNAVETLREESNKLSADVRRARQELDDLRGKVPETSSSVEEAKVSLEEALKIRSMLNMKLASERIDAALPRTVLVEILDWAKPVLKPVKPNNTLNIFFGFVVGGVAGLIIATGVHLLQRVQYRRSLAGGLRARPPSITAVK